MRNKKVEEVKKELANEVSDLFAKIDRALYDYHCFDFDDEDVGKLRESLSVLRGKFSMKVFDSGKFLNSLNKLDAGRWSIKISDGWFTTESDISDNYARLTTADDVAYDVATWMFDQIGSHPNRFGEPFEHDEINERIAGVYPRMIEALGDELAELSLDAWTDGRHDT